MENRFKGWIVIALAVTAALSFLVLSVPGQQQQAAYRAPRTKDGKPDLNGIWQAMNEANWDLEAHSSGPAPLLTLGALGAVPPGLGIVEGGTIPYKPEALAQRKKNFDNRLKDDPEVKCFMPGVPRAMYMPFPFQIIQSPQSKLVMMVFEYAGMNRTIYMDSNKPAPTDTWMGWSNGHWEGETLVIDTTGFNDLSWFDRAGNYHSDALHVVERITARSADTLNYEATISDKNVFTKDWKISMPLYRRVEKNAQILEFRCAEYSEEVLYGHLRKVPLTNTPK